MNKKLALKIVFSVFILVLGWGLLWSWFITRTVRKNNSDNSMKNQHAIVKNIIVTETQNEIKYWEFYAKTGEYNSEHNAIQLNDVIGNFYDKNEEVVISFKSQKGNYDEKSKKVILDGENLFVARDGSQLFADKVVWQGQDKDILAYGNIQFIQEGKIVTKANKAVFNPDLTVFKVIGKTKTEIFGDDEQKKKYTTL